MDVNPTLDNRPAPSTGFRWLVLFVISLTMFGNYFIYDSINPVTDLMKRQIARTTPLPADAVQATPNELRVRLRLDAPGLWSVKAGETPVYLWVPSSANREGNAPAITVVEPGVARISDQPQRVTLRGTNFKPDTTVRVCFIDCADLKGGEIQLVNTAEIQFNAKLDQTGWWSVTAANGDATSEAFPITVTAAPTAGAPVVSSIDPAAPAVSNADQWITVRGEGLTSEGVAVSRYFTDQEIGRLNSAYNFAAVLVLLLGGIIIDRLGTKISIFIFAAICVVASILTVATSSPNVIIASRFLLGVGSEPLIVAVTTALAKWFKGKELSFAFGLNLAIARLGSIAADNSPNWAHGFVDFNSWRGAVGLGITFAVIAVVAAALYWMLEAMAQRKYNLGTGGTTDKLVLGDIFRFGLAFWFVVGLCMTFYSAVFPFRTFAVKFFIEGHGVSRELGGFLNSVLPQAAMVATPLFGLFADKFGRRSLLMMIGSILLIPSFLLMLPALDVNLYLPIILLGISFSLIPAVMWPSVAYLVEEKRLGTAYALMTLLQQLGNLGMNEFLGSLNDRAGASAANPTGYNSMIYALAALGLSGIVFAFLLKRARSARSLETVKA